MFTLFDLSVNDNVNDGGEEPRRNENGQWIPPVRSGGFYQPVPGHMYRWEEGSVSFVGDCIWYDGKWWAPDRLTPLSEYRTSSMYWCNPFVQFQTSRGDASTRDIEDSMSNFDCRWWPLSFAHAGALSQLPDGMDPFLSGSETPWVGQLGLRSYINSSADPTTPSTGLGGDLSYLIGIIGFTCQSDQLYNVLITDRAWHRNRWRGHQRGHGRKYTPSHQ